MRAVPVLYGMLLSFTCAHVGFAQESPTPKTVLTESQRGRAEMLITLAEVERYAPQIASSDELYSFISILDDLDVLRANYQFDELGGNPVRKSALALTKQAIKWIRFDRDTEEDIENFLRWAPDETRYSATGMQTYFLNSASGKKEVLHWADVVAKAIAILAEQKSQAYVLNAYHELQGMVVNQALTATVLDDQEFLTLIKQSSSVPALRDVLSTLEQQAIGANDQVALKNSVTRVIATGQILHSLPVAVPIQVRNAPGQILQEVLEKLLFQGQSPEIETIEPGLTLLQAPQMMEMSGWMSQLVSRGIAPQQMSYVWQLSQKLLQKLTEAGLTRQVLDLKKTISHLKVLQMTYDDPIEGTYQGHVGGHETTLTLVNASPTAIIVGMRVLQNGSVNYEYSQRFVNYNTDTDEFEGIRFTPNDPQNSDNSTDRESFLRFTVKNGRLTGRFMVNGKNLPIDVTIKERLNNYSKLADLPLEQQLSSVSGDYTGGRFHLLLTQLEAMCSGTGYIRVRDQVVDVAFTSGYYNRRNGTIYLTSGEQESGKWLHVRGVIRNGVLQGEYIMGGRGRYGEPFTLKLLHHNRTRG